MNPRKERRLLELAMLIIAVFVIVSPLQQKFLEETINFAIAYGIALLVLFLIWRRHRKMGRAPAAAGPGEAEETGVEETGEEFAGEEETGEEAEEEEFEEEEQGREGAG